ncbi:AtpZ/AtpI family protein [Rhodobaculum claviforme]|uniref:ATP synthase protein I n=1 Tax=Rhodobaculum claviforme TaxID=1549854 RepID=A0A934TIG8_9RHOB|nr:AtpZ/AtpI family protein [Rhodobaculum claviforme]MBK5926764.1 hypothetical protein [Rhodobaculum claviforme]
MGDHSEQERLRRLGERIARMKGEVDPPSESHKDAHSQGQMAWRMVSELVAGLLVGFGMGYGLDALFGTQPWLLLLFTALGFAAGVQGVMRTAQGMQRTLEAEARAAAAGKTPVQGAGKPAGSAPATEQRGDTRRG